MRDDFPGGRILRRFVVVGGSVEAVEDNFVLDSSATTVQTNGDNLLVKFATANRRKTWAKFDLAGKEVDSSVGGSITVLYLGPSAGTVNGTIEVRALNAPYTPGSGKLGTEWDETAITWNNAPGNASNNALDDCTTTVLGTFNYSSSTTPTNSPITVPFTQALSNFIQPDGSVTVILNGIAQNNVSPTINFASSENPNFDGPTMNYSLPEPAGLMAVTAGGPAAGVATAAAGVRQGWCAAVRHPPG